MKELYSNTLITVTLFDSVIIHVPKTYDHNKQLITFKNKLDNEFVLFENKIEDQFLNKSVKSLSPNNFFKFFILKISLKKGLNNVSIDDLILMFNELKVNTSGVQGLTLVWDYIMHKLPDNNPLFSFTDKKIVWGFGQKYFGEPMIFKSNKKFNFNFGEYNHVNSLLLCYMRC